MAAPPDYPVRFREQSRLVAASQHGAGAVLDQAPDVSVYHGRQNSADLLFYAQRRLGLYISNALEADRTLAAAGETPDPLGDNLINLGEHTSRHTSVLIPVHRAISATATGPVVLGDKGRREQAYTFNAGHVFDIAQVGGSRWLTDWLGDVKVASALTASHKVGLGRKGAGSCRSDGHLFAFGNTEDEYKVLVYGTRRRGRRIDGPFNHNTGRGFVDDKVGQYDDAIYCKRNQVSLLLAEDGGGIAPGLQRVLKGSARTAGDRKRGRDGTLYSIHRPSGYYTHHLRAIATGAALGSARHGNAQIVSKKQRALESRSPPCHQRSALDELILSGA